MKKVLLLLAAVFSASLLFAQKPEGIRFKIMNDQAQLVNINDSMLDQTGLGKSKSLSLLMLGQPGQKIKITEIKITVIQVQLKTVDVVILGNKVAESEPVMADIRRCRPGDKIYFDAITYVVGEGKPQKIAQGYAFTVK